MLSHLCVIKSLHRRVTTSKFVFCLHVLCTCLLADQGACAAGSQLPAEMLSPSLVQTSGYEQTPSEEQGSLQCCCPHPLRTSTRPGYQSLVGCLPLPEVRLELAKNTSGKLSCLPPDLKLGPSWRRTVSYLEAFKNNLDLFIPKFAFHPK